MTKIEAKQLSFEEFKVQITEDMLTELTKMHISYEKAFDILGDLVIESELYDDDEFGTMDEIVKKIVKDYIEELMYRAFNKYELDWE